MTNVDSLRFHPYHLVNVSPWPFLISIMILNFALNLITAIVSHEDFIGLLFNLSIII